MWPDSGGSRSNSSPYLLSGFYCSLVSSAIPFRGLRIGASETVLLAVKARVTVRWVGRYCRNRGKPQKIGADRRTNKPEEKKKTPLHPLTHHFLAATPPSPAAAPTAPPSSLPYPAPFHPLHHPSHPSHPLLPPRSRHRPHLLSLIPLSLIPGGQIVQWDVRVGGSGGGPAGPTIFDPLLSVLCDESGHTKFPFSYLNHVTLLTLAQARLSFTSGFAHAGSPLPTRITIFGRLRRNRFNAKVAWNLSHMYTWPKFTLFFALTLAFLSLLLLSRRIPTIGPIAKIVGLQGEEIDSIASCII